MKVMKRKRKEGRRRNCTESFGPVVEVGRNPPRSQSERDPAMGPAASSSRETVVVVRTGVMPWQPRSEEWRWRERTSGIEKVLDVCQDGYVLLVLSGLWLVACWIASWCPFQWVGLGFPFPFRSSTTMAVQSTKYMEWSRFRR